MKNYINRFEFYILLEPYIEELKLHSPLLELVLNAPLEEYEQYDIEKEKEELEIVLSEENRNNLKEIISVLANPEYAYKIALEVGKTKYVNELYERDGKIVEYLFDEKGRFSLDKPLKHNEKINNYIKLLDVSDYQLDFTQVKHILSYDEYVVLNIAFSLEEISRKIGIVGEGELIHFTIDDIVTEFRERNYKVIEGLSFLFDDDYQPEQPMDIPKQVKSLLSKGYLTILNDNKLTLGDKSITLFDNLFTLNSVFFSYSNMKFTQDNDEVKVNYGMFKSNKKSCFFMYFEHGNIVIKIIPDRETLKELMFKAFRLDS